MMAPNLGKAEVEGWKFFKATSRTLTSVALNDLVHTCFNFFWGSVYEKNNYSYYHPVLATFVVVVVFPTTGHICIFLLG